MVSIKTRRSDSSPSLPSSWRMFARKEARNSLRAWPWHRLSSVHHFIQQSKTIGGQRPLLPTFGEWGMPTRSFPTAKGWTPLMRLSGPGADLRHARLHQIFCSVHDFDGPSRPVVRSIHSGGTTVLGPAMRLVGRFMVTGRKYPRTRGFRFRRCRWNAIPRNLSLPRSSESRLAFGAHQKAISNSQKINRMAPGTAVWPDFILFFLGSTRACETQPPRIADRSVSGMPSQVLMCIKASELCESIREVGAGLPPQWTRMG